MSQSGSPSLLALRRVSRPAQPGTGLPLSSASQQTDEKLRLTFVVGGRRIFSLDWNVSLDRETTTPNSRYMLHLQLETLCVKQAITA